MPLMNIPFPHVVHNFSVVMVRRYHIHLRDQMIYTATKPENSSSLTGLDGLVFNVGFDQFGWEWVQFVGFWIMRKKLGLAGYGSKQFRVKMIKTLVKARFFRTGQRIGMKGLEPMASQSMLSCVSSACVTSFHVKRASQLGTDLYTQAETTVCGIS